MTKFIFIIFLILKSINSYAAPIDIPEKIILSKDDLYLKGKVKTISDSVDAIKPKGAQNQNNFTIYFYENGLVEKIDSSIGTSGQEFFYDETFTKLIRHESFYNSNAQTKTSHLIGIVKDYSNNYPSNIIYSLPQASNIIVSNKNITFQNNIEVIEYYSLSSALKLNITSKISNFYDPKTHLLVKSIKIFPSLFKNGDFDKVEVNYNDLGRTSIISKYGTTQFYYKNNELIEESNLNDLKSKLLYSDYKYDNCKNWISRVVKYNDQITLQERSFTYYKNC